MLASGRRVYDKFSPPKQARDAVTKVKLAMYIEGMSSFRTQTMDFQLDVYFQQFWKDPRLSHNETRRILIRDRNVLNSMWLPDVYFANARTADFHEVTQPNFLLWIEPDGSILYDTRVSMVVVCTLKLHKWPLDSQHCNLRILSYAYTTEQLVIEWKEDEEGVEAITRNDLIAMSDMKIVRLYPGKCDGNYSTGVWSCVTAEFRIKREFTHHLMSNYVPTTLIVVISWFSFWLDCEAGGVPARVSLAITTLLTLSTQAGAARMALPEVSYMKAIDVWMGACMFFVFSVMIEFTVVNFAQRQVMASSLESMAEKATSAKPTSSQQITERARNLLNRVRGRQSANHRQLVEVQLQEHILQDASSAPVPVPPCDCPEPPAHSHSHSLISPTSIPPVRSSSTNSFNSEGVVSRYDPLDDYHCRVSSVETPTVTPRIICDHLYKDSTSKAERLANWQMFDTDSSETNSRRGSNATSAAKLIPAEAKQPVNYGSTNATNKIVSMCNNNNHSNAVVKKTTSNATTKDSSGEKKRKSSQSSRTWNNVMKKLQAQK
ncbi:hypothetical protein WR25_19922 [Diploscapter pachys]|uniref:Uncharacterized protein n=1 Tax=Diploscapter pachys TaxID=2018661 RepID=A0A2A2LYA5_9BILA|nr:hypothetical protein WR25_19922 [Diploscapter pachys]